MYYVEDFDYSAFEDSLELNSGTSRFLSFSFTRKCIGIAGAGLIVEDAQ